MVFFDILQAHLRDVEGSVPDLYNKASFAIKRVIIFLLVEGLAFGLKKNKNKKKMQHL